MLRNLMRKFVMPIWLTLPGRRMTNILCHLNAIVPQNLPLQKFTRLTQNQLVLRVPKTTYVLLQLTLIPTSERKEWLSQECGMDGLEIRNKKDATENNMMSMARFLGLELVVNGLEEMIRKKKATKKLWMNVMTSSVWCIAIQMRWLRFEEPEIRNCS